MRAARTIAGKLLGIVVSRLEAGQVVELLTQLCGSFKAQQAGFSHKFEERSGSLTAAGYVLAQSATGTPGFQILSLRLAGLCSDKQATLFFHLVQ